MSGIAGAIPVLKEGVRWRLEAGHRYIVMQVRRRSKPKNWDRVRVFPGVYGRCLGECDAPGVWLIDVPIDTLADYLGLRGA